MTILRKQGPATFLRRTDRYLRCYKVFLSLTKYDGHQIVLQTLLYQMDLVDDEETFVFNAHAWLGKCLHDSIVVSIPACHAGDRGSIPRRGAIFISFFIIC